MSEPDRAAIARGLPSPGQYRAAQGRGDGSFHLLRAVAHEGRVTALFAESHAKTDLSDLDMGRFVDCDRKSAEAHVSYTWVGMEGDGFPVGKVVHPELKAVLLVDGVSPAIQGGGS